jgi:aminoglycoside phosphotransferase (APT) family kinase protein
MAVLDPGWADVLRSRLPAVEAGLSAGTGRVVLTHGDLHDRQILVAPRGVGVIDADTAAGGEAAQDVANLLVHLELRAAQGRCLAARAGALAAAILDGYGPGPDVVARLPAYAAATRLRLAAVYRLRPRDPRVCMGLLDRLHDPVPGL